MKDLALQKPFLQTIETTSPQAKNYYGLRKLFTDYLGKVNVPFYDTCCPTASIPDSFPTRYFDGDLQYFDGTEWVTISVGGSVTTQMSITEDGSGIKLVNDEASPGNYQVYSTNSGGIRGWNDGIFGSGTVSGSKLYLPKFSNTNTITSSRIIEITNATGNYVTIDDFQTGVTTTNNFLLNVANNWTGDSSSSLTPLVFFASRANSVFSNINVLQLCAPSAQANSTITHSLGRSAASRDLWLTSFNYIGSNSTSNYVEETFHSIATVRRSYASGNTTFGVAADNGFKVEISTTLKVGTKLHIGTPANASIGTATLVGGTVTVNTTAVATGSKIFITRNTPGGTVGDLSVPDASIVDGTSFVINSASGTDTSTVNYWIIN